MLVEGWEVPSCGVRRFLGWGFGRDVGRGFEGSKAGKPGWIEAQGLSWPYSGSGAFGLPENLLEVAEEGTWVKD